MIEDLSFYKVLWERLQGTLSVLSITTNNTQKGQEQHRASHVISRQKLPTSPPKNSHQTAIS